MNRNNVRMPLELKNCYQYRREIRKTELGIFLPT